MPRKPRPPAEASKPAFVVADAEHTDFLGLTKNDWFAGFVLLGLFAGPMGRVVLKTSDDEVLRQVADLARHMGDVMVARGVAA